MIRALLLATAAPTALAAPLTAGAQHMDHTMHAKPGRQPAPTPAPPSSPTPAPKHPSRTDPHAGHPAAARTATPPARNTHADHTMHDMAEPDAGTSPAPDAHTGYAMHGMATPDEGASPAPRSNAGHTMHGMAEASPQAPAGTDLSPGTAPAPLPATDHLADRFWGASAMAASRRDDLRREHGGMTYRQLLFNIAEYQVRDGRDGYRWDGEAWIGGDINRLTIKSEGEGDFRGALAQAEVQALYSRALDPYWNLQAGIRHDVRPDPSRTYAVLGIEGLAPYWFDVEAALFLSNKGDLLARVEAYYDQRITNLFVLQPRGELNLAAQDVPENGVGAGLTSVELGLRLRYDRHRDFAPYIGVSFERKLGNTGRFARAAGQDTGGFSFVAGVRSWF